jgi:hypothetical protein
MRRPIRVCAARSVTRAKLWLATLTLVGSALALLAASPAWASEVKDVRVGKHPAFTRIVFELDSASGYQIERNEPAPGISELVVSLDASGPSGEIDGPRALIAAGRLQADGRRTVAHIRLSKDGLRLKEMTLREPARIVIDFIDDHPKVAAVAPKPAVKPETARKPVPSPKSESASSSETTAPSPKAAAPIKVVEEPKPAPKPKPAAKPKAVVKTKPIVEPKAAAAQPVVSESTDDVVEPPASAVTEEKTGAVARSAGDLMADAHSDPTAPSAVPERAVPAPASNGARSSLPNAAAVPEAAGGIFTARNATWALAGIALLVAGSYLIARRRRDAEDYGELDDDDFGDDNPFAGLESAGEAPARASDDSATTEQTDLFAGVSATTEAAESGPQTIQTEGSDMSMDGTTDFAADPGAATTLSAPPGATPDLEGIMRMVRELATRVGDLETRLEDAVDAKERLERQVAAQTEELRVQRAAIARTQRAVRNMSQSTEDGPTEPAPREPRAGE